MWIVGYNIIIYKKAWEGIGLEKITQTEADAMLTMLKESLTQEITFPTSGQQLEFKVKGKINSNVFAINIYRGKIQKAKYNIGARIEVNGTMLLELHIGATNIHWNPDGEKIIGNHWHIFHNGLERKWAFSAEDIQSDMFVENTIMFLEKFNVVDKPEVIYQQELL